MRFGRCLSTYTNYCTRAEKKNLDRRFRNENNFCENSYKNFDDEQKQGQLDISSDVDIAIAPDALNIRSFLDEKQIVKLDHLPHSIGLAPCDFYHFKKLKTSSRSIV